MDKPNLLYVSPFWPMKSGISEYSESLVFGLKEYFDITLLVDNYKVENKKLQKEFKILNYDNTMDYSDYKYILYILSEFPVISLKYNRVIIFFV